MRYFAYLIGGLAPLAVGLNYAATMGIVDNKTRILIAASLMLILMCYGYWALRYRHIAGKECLLAGAVGIISCWYAAYSWYELFSAQEALVIILSISLCIFFLAYYLEQEILAWIAIIGLYVAPRLPATFDGLFHVVLIPLSAMWVLITTITAPLFIYSCMRSNWWILAYIVASNCFYRVYQYADAAVPPVLITAVGLIYVGTVIIIPYWFLRQRQTLGVASMFAGALFTVLYLAKHIAEILAAPYLSESMAQSLALYCALAIALCYGLVGLWSIYKQPLHNHLGNAWCVASLTAIALMLYDQETLPVFWHYSILALYTGLILLLGYMRKSIHIMLLGLAAIIYLLMHTLLFM